jgi:3-hydroxyisobutyrate dehydrogenase
MLANEMISTHSRLGFIGLGYLGSRIARRLIAAGFPMVVYDLDHAKARQFKELGAEVAPNPGSLAREADVVLSCLTDELAVETVYMGRGNVLHSARPGTRIIEMSTIAPETSRQLHRSAREFDLAVLDVAVSGSTATAEAGALTLFGAGERQVFESSESRF